jgi:hypothetical protein
MKLQTGTVRLHVFTTSTQKTYVNQYCNGINIYICTQMRRTKMSAVCVFNWISC